MKILYKNITANCRKSILFILLCLYVLALFFYYCIESRDDYETNYDDTNNDEWLKMKSSMDLHKKIVENFYASRVVGPTSRLGRILFGRDVIPYPNPNENRYFLILVWKQLELLKKRFNDSGNYLADCTVKNCIFSGNEDLIDEADAVLIKLQRNLSNPKVKLKRNPMQRWIFWYEESPITVNSRFNETVWEDFINVFNWSMSYRSDADVPVPYGRTIPLSNPIWMEPKMNDIAMLVPNWLWKSRRVLVAAHLSECDVDSKNMLLLNALRKYVQIDVYGKCSDVEENKKKCRNKSTCTPLVKYLFYLVLEDSNCFQYLTEQVFFNAYENGAVPIIRGHSQEDLDAQLPPNSFLYIEKGANISLLAEEIKSFIDDKELLLFKHVWRNNFKVVNEHGYFGTRAKQLCRLCEALNYNDKTEKIYQSDDIDSFLNSSLLCKKINK